MKINRLLFNNKDYVFSGEIDFSSIKFDPYHIKEIKTATFNITGSIFEDLLMLKVKVEVDVIGVCAYTLEDVPLHIKTTDNIEISNEIEDDDTIFFEKDNIFEIDPYILSIIVSEIPPKIVKKGAKLPGSGKGYRVLSEEEYIKEEESKVDSRWSKLDDLDLD